MMYLQKLDNIVIHVKFIKVMFNDTFSSKISMILSFALEGFLEPHLEQNKSPSSIKWPHWVQYTIFFVTRALDKPWKADFWDDSNSEKMKKRFWKKSKYCEKQKKKSEKKEKSREKNKVWLFLHGFRRRATLKFSIHY